MKQKITTFFKDKDLLYIFVYKLSVRRHYIPILSIFYLSLDNTTLNQIGIFSAIWMLMWMLLEIPSGYISDTIGHKKTLYLSRFSMIISLWCFILWGSILWDHSFVLFILGMVFMNFGFAFNSGTLEAYFYEILESRGEEKQFSKVSSRMNGNVSLVAVLFLITLPFTLKIHALFPFLINIVFDIIWIVALLRLPDPRDSKKVMTWETQGFLSMFRDSIKLWFLPFALFIGLIGWIMHGKHAFDTVYLENLWLAAVFIGFLMWTSRVLRFLFSRRIHLLEEYFSMKDILTFQVVLYSVWLSLVAYTQSFIVWLICLAIMTAFQHSIWSIHTKYIFNNYLKNPKYKATINSVKSQIINLIWVVVSFALGIIMEKSFQTWYSFLSVIMFVWLAVCYYFIFRQKNNENI